MFCDQVAIFIFVYLHYYCYFFYQNGSYCHIFKLFVSQQKRKGNQTYGPVVYLQHFLLQHL